MRPILVILVTVFVVPRAFAFEVWNELSGARVTLEPGMRIEVRTLNGGSRTKATYNLVTIVSVEDKTLQVLTEQGVVESISDPRAVFVEVDYAMVFSDRVERGYKVNKISLFEFERAFGTVEAVFSSRNVYIRRSPNLPLQMIGERDFSDYRFRGERLKRGPEAPAAVRSCFAFSQ